MSLLDRLAFLACALVALSPLLGRLNAAPTYQAATSADEVAQAIQDRDTGRDSRAEMRMRLFDRQGRARERVMSLLTMKGVGDDGDRTLVRFTYPNDIRGTSFLVWEHPRGDDERFLFLPALGRVRRIAGQEKQEDRKSVV